MDITQTLFEHGHLSAEQLIELRLYSKASFKTPIEALRELKFLPDEALPNFFRQYLHVRSLTDNDILNLDTRLAQLIPEDVAIHLRVACIGGHKNRLFIAMEDPSDRNIKQQLEFFIAKKIVPVAASRQQLNKLLERFYKKETRSEINTKASYPNLPQKEPSTQIQNNTNLNLQKKEEDSFVTEVGQKIQVSDQNMEAANTSIDDVPNEFELDENSSKSEKNSGLTSKIDRAALNRQISSVLIKVAFCKNIVEAIDLLNQKIADFGISVALVENGFSIRTQNTNFELFFDKIQQPHEQPEIHILMPILRQISRLK